MSATSERVRYEIVPVEGTVNERNLVLWVRDKFFNAATTLVVDTTLSNFMTSENIPKGDAITEGFGSYLYKEQLPKVEGCLRFLFVKSKTEREALTEVRPHQELNEIVSWPDWLVSLYALEALVSIQSETGTSGASATTNLIKARRYFDRYVLVKGGEFNTKTIVRHYFSPTQIRGLQATEPRPMPIFYSSMGMSNSLNCIHEEVRIPELDEILRRVPNWGMVSSREVTWNQGSVFPATNMTAWVPHIRKLITTPRDGGIYYQAVTVIPPNPFQALEI